MRGNHNWDKTGDKGCVLKKKKKKRKGRRTDEQEKIWKGGKNFSKNCSGKRESEGKLREKEKGIKGLSGGGGRFSRGSPNGARRSHWISRSSKNSKEGQKTDAKRKGCQRRAEKKNLLEPERSETNA